MDLHPFTAEEIRQMAEPFSAAHTPLDEPTLDAIRIACGGNPALTAYGLQKLWEGTERSAGAVGDVYSRFQDEQREFVRAFRSSLTDGRVEQVPEKLLRRIEQSPGEVAQEALVSEISDSSSLDVDDGLRMLSAAGLIRVSSPLTADPVRASVIPSVLLLRHNSRRQPKLHEHVALDIGELASQMFAMSADYYRGAGPARGLVPEAVFSASFALGLHALGWRVERESQRVVGRTDLKLARGDYAGHGIVELKIWGRNDYVDVHSQVVSYASQHTESCVAVMIGEAVPNDWADRYQEQVLTGKGVTIDGERRRAPFIAEFMTSAVTPQHVTVPVLHVLLQLPRR